MHEVLWLICSNKQTNNQPTKQTNQPTNKQTNTQTHNKHTKHIKTLQTNSNQTKHEMNQPTSRQKNKVTQNSCINNTPGKHTFPPSSPEFSVRSCEFVPSPARFSSGRLSKQFELGLDWDRALGGRTPAKGRTV